MMLTIFTPTYNRATLLPRLYQSLINQSDHDFEWLIVDDGSADDTEAYVGAIIAENKIRIRYYWQENRGKHQAYNKAVSLAQGEYFFCVDSDDFLVPDAIAAIHSQLGRLLESDCGLVGGKVSISGISLCSGLKENLPHAGLYTLNRMYGVHGEVSLIFKTELLRRNPYPVVPGERFIGESILYDTLEMQGYTLCPMPQSLTVCEYQNDGLSSAAYRLMRDNPGGYACYHGQRIDLVVGVGERIRHAIQYQAFRRLSGKKLFPYCGKYGLCVRSAYLPGLLAAAYYKRKFKQTG